MDTQNDDWEMAINYSFNTWPYSVSMLNFWGVSTAKGAENLPPAQWPGDMASPRSNDVVILPSRHPPSAEVLGSPVPVGSPALSTIGGKGWKTTNPMDSNSAGNGRGI